ncbi:MAG: hypothetical protein LBT10_02145 [Methanobrevibacter sp.]|jgi:hypothetical protein|nr:hypothetical protein [Methanobrevibacter sp.]
MEIWNLEFEFLAEKFRPYMSLNFLSYVFIFSIAEIHSNFTPPNMLLKVFLKHNKLPRYFLKNYIKNFGTVKLAWIFTIEKLKTDDKSLITCTWSKLFLLQIQIPDCEFPSSFYSASNIVL